MRGEVVVSGTVTILGEVYPVEAPTIGKAKREAAHEYQKKYRKEFQEKYGQDCLIGDLVFLASWDNRVRKKPGRKQLYSREVLEETSGPTNTKVSEKILCPGCETLKSKESFVVHHWPWTLFQYQAKKKGQTIDICEACNCRLGVLFPHIGDIPWEIQLQKLQKHYKKPGRKVKYLKEVLTV